MQILPEKDSKEYQWMRSVTERYGLIRQGIILENALTKFEHSDLSTVIENVLKWISRRLHEIVEAIQK
ncbi:unnamed protein product [Anisakis simplex]|uniref:Four helix bundle protein n=1 Tax=Anisakis simplex TaxID=6269 RepID=A0A0M3JLN7_ANISI|nr:unnamed protein product [Anisakis simplex]